MSAHDPAQARAEAALLRLRESGSVRVLANSSLAAFAWRDGTLFVTRGLVERLDAGELSAALAHELAHLSGLGDQLPPDSAEALADRIGSDLLRASGLDPALMLQMLGRVGPALAGAHAARFEARIRALSEALGSSPVVAAR